MGTFSEFWYRVKDRRIALRPQVRVRRQYFRGETWYVVEDPFNNQFFRIHPAAWAFLARLGPRRTVGEVWSECLERDPEGTPGQDEVIQLLAQLYHANLLRYHLPSDAVELFDRYTRRRQTEIRGRLMSIMFSRFPLLDPDRFLQKTLPYVGWFFGPVGFLLWLGMMGVAAMHIVANWGAFLDQGQSVLAPGNLVMLYVALVGIKVVHEFGHAYACRRDGGEVHVMGVMLLIFTPIPYVDATASWAFRNRWRRALVGAAGMMAELFVAALAAVVWANVGAGALRGLAYNVMFVASVSTLLFNLNPLLRFDGYYILSDLLDVPNLHSRSTRQLRHLVERYAFGCPQSLSPARSPSEAVWLAVFAVLSGIYRVFVFAMILLFVADQFLLVGILMAALCLVSWILVPTGRLVHYLLTSPRLERTRGRAIRVTVCVAGLLVAGLYFIPFPHRFRAPGVVISSRRMEVVSHVPGRLVEMLATPGETVVAGTPLVRMENPELERQIAAARARSEQVEALLRQAIRDGSADLAAIMQNRAAVAGRLATLNARREALWVRAGQSGTWMVDDIESRLRGVLPRGFPLGYLLEEQSFDFVAVVEQDQASRLFEHAIEGAEIRLRGQPGRALKTDTFTRLQVDRGILPDPSLGWRGGGPLEVDPADPEGLRAVESFFEVRARLPAESEVAYRHGLSGVMRFRLPPEPLLRQGWRSFRQLLQQRYGW